jgi:hypothetical protein
MVHQTAKKNSLHPKKHHKKLSPAEAIGEVQEKVHKLSHEHVDNIVHTAGEYSHAATQGMKHGSENIHALLESGTKASGIYKDMSGQIVKGYNRMFSDSVELSKEIFVCRTSKDMIELQSKAAGQLCEDYFDMTNKLCSMLFDSYTEALTSFGEHKTVMSDTFKKARAA